MILSKMYYVLYNDFFSINSKLSMLDKTNKANLITDNYSLTNKTRITLYPIPRGD